MKTMTLLILTFWCQVILGQHQFDQDSLGAVHPFLHLESNTLILPGDTAGWTSFFCRIRQLARDSAGRLEVMHLGGSHVQGGSMSRQIRYRFAALVGDSTGGSPGFFFPYPLAGTNSPREIRASSTTPWQGSRSVKRDQPSPFGLSGVSARTDRAYDMVDLHYMDADTATFTGVRIFGRSLQANYTLAPLGWSCPDTIVSDSMAGFQQWTWSEPQRLLSFQILPATPTMQDTFVLQGIQYLHPGSRLIFDQVGANGASLASTLRCEGLAAQLQFVTPDLVILGIGVNDANVPNGEFRADRFQAGYDSLLTLFRTARPDVRFIFLTNNDTYYKRRQPNRNALAVREAMKELAIRWNACIWDQFEVMGGLGSIHAWHKAGLAKRDRLHFTPAGYTLIANLFMDAFEAAVASFCPSPSMPTP